MSTGMAAGLRHAAAICFDLKIDIDRKIAENPNDPSSLAWRAQSQGYAVVGNRIMDALEDTERFQVFGRQITAE